MSADSNSSRNPQDRPPRFVLKQHEQQALAFSRGLGQPMSLAQKVMDFSPGGVAFVCAINECPEVGEVLQIEMKILNNVHTMNRKGRVLRAETLQGEDGISYIRVAVQFLDEPITTATLVSGTPAPYAGLHSGHFAYVAIAVLVLVMIVLFIFM
jgi:hypothetical protein